jgi:rRNA processing protein Gar1
MDERIGQIKELLGQINAIVAEIEGSSELPPEEQKQVEKKKYLGMKPEDREVVDKKKLKIDEPLPEEE